MNFTMLQSSSVPLFLRASALNFTDDSYNCVT
jgi:hypothetical protein